MTGCDIVQFVFHSTANPHDRRIAFLRNYLTERTRPYRKCLTPYLFYYSAATRSASKCSYSPLCSFAMLSHRSWRHNKDQTRHTFAWHTAGSKTIDSYSFWINGIWASTSLSLSLSRSEQRSDIDNFRNTLSGETAPGITLQSSTRLNTLQDYRTIAAIWAFGVMPQRITEENIIGNESRYRRKEKTTYMYNIRIISTVGRTTRLF